MRQPLHTCWFTVRYCHFGSVFPFLQFVSAAFGICSSVLSWQSSSRLFAFFGLQKVRWWTCCTMYCAHLKIWFPIDGFCCTSLLRCSMSRICSKGCDQVGKGFLFALCFCACILSRREGKFGSLSRPQNQEEFCKIPMLLVPIRLFAIIYGSIQAHVALWAPDFFLGRMVQPRQISNLGIICQQSMFCWCVLTDLPFLAAVPLFTQSIPFDLISSLVPNVFDYVWSSIDIPLDCAHSVGRGGNDAESDVSFQKSYWFLVTSMEFTNSQGAKRRNLQTISEAF